MTTFEAFTALNNDAARVEKVKNECKTPEQVYEILKSIGLTDSFETFKKAAAEINSSMTTMDEKEVEAIAGGVDTTVTTVTISATAAAAAAI